MLDNSHGIIANPEALEENYVPPELPCREAQKKELAFCLSPLQRGLKPFDCLCHGKSGTGKTALVKYVLNQVNENTNALAFYVNCWENKTLNLILNRLIEQAGIILSETGYSAKLERLKLKLKNRACVIALDEVDRLEDKALNDILYMLKGLGKVGLVCISNTRKYFLSLDPRVSSRLSFNSISFPPYSNEELLTILRHRIIDCRALYPNSYSREVLEEIADLACGDARMAIQTLRNSAIIAEKADRTRITLEDVGKAYEEIKEIKKKYMLEKLGEHYKLIYEIVRSSPGITSRELIKIYRNECKNRSLNPKSHRALNNYLNELMALGYIEQERASVKGNVRKFSTFVE
jgi:cell division control protein 6